MGGGRRVKNVSRKNTHRAVPICGIQLKLFACFAYALYDEDCHNKLRDRQETEIKQVNFRCIKKR